MAKGDGCIQQLGRNYWRVRIDFGTDPITGKRQRVERRVRGSKNEARKIRDEIRQEHEHGLSVDGSKLTFNEFVEVWHQSYLAAGTAAADTVDRARVDVLALSPYIGNVAMKDIDARLIETAYAALKHDKQAAGGHFGGTSMHKLHVLLKQVFKKAVDYDIILRNPLDRVTAPKKDDPERRSLSAEEYARMFACVDEAEQEAYTELAEKESRQLERGNAFGRTYLYGIAQVSCLLAVRLALATGMRRGEVFGLSWNNVDLSQPSIKVRQSLTVNGRIKEPKTKAGRRTIHIDQATGRHLAKWKDRQAVELSKIGVYQNEETPVCCSNTGGWFDLNNFGRWWRPWSADNGFGDLKFHEIRHTHATLLLASGVDVKTTQTRMGHSSATITLEWYAHAVPDNDRKAADLLGKLATLEPQGTPILEVKTA